ncbi:MAG: hypothetical protein Ct9H90mP15_09420 [Candidatus Neomarinimicrobiota bacterium]|nr:MAG: hypothetical protein Ct9H90mP15_09420 [Candidatus Neomarinimicrobiota bacterium]
MEESVYKTIKELHNYDIPEITTMEAKNVDPDYLNWINELMRKINMNDNNYKESIWYRIERFFDRHNHLMEFIRTVLAFLY